MVSIQNTTEVFAKQRKHFMSTHKFKPVSHRINQLRFLKNWIKTNELDIETALFEDLKKHPVEVSFGEIKIILVEIEDAINKLYHWTSPRKVETPLYLLGTRSEVRTEPRGVCLILSPWNFPFNLTVGPLVSALAAGNCCILKPSEHTPKTSDLMQKMIEELFPIEEVALFQGAVDIANELLDLPFDHIFFTGSPEVGKIVMKKAAENLTSVTLELGGENPVIVDETANLNDTATKLAWNIGFNAGQSCVSSNYIFVHESVIDKLCEKVETELNRMYKTSETIISQNPDYGRLANDRHFNHVFGLIEDAVTNGATITSLENSNAEERFVAPTLLRNVSLNSKIMNVESFGPLAPFISYQKVEEAYDYILSKPKPLASYLFTSSRKNRERFLNTISSGLSVINDTAIPFIHNAMPFGGVNYSGMGKSHGIDGFKAFSNEKAVTYQRTGFTIPKLIYPPYSNFKRTLIRLVNWWM
jgi:aldehyde dehydrogenase (NAD+)